MLFSEWMINEERKARENLKYISNKNFKKRKREKIEKPKKNTIHKDRIEKISGKWESIKYDTEPYYLRINNEVSFLIVMNDNTIIGYIIVEESNNNVLFDFSNNIIKEFRIWYINAKSQLWTEGFMNDSNLIIWKDEDKWIKNSINKNKKLYKKTFLSKNRNWIGKYSSEEEQKLFIELNICRNSSPLGLEIPSFFNISKKKCNYYEGEDNFGIFAKQSILSKMLIGEYRGIIIDNENRTVLCKLHGIMYGLVNRIEEDSYLIEIENTDKLLNENDKKTSSWVRFVKTSSEKANAKFELYNDENKNPHIILETIKNIKKGEQILVYKKKSSKEMLVREIRKELGTFDIYSTGVKTEISLRLKNIRLKNMYKS